MSVTAIKGKDDLVRDEEDKIIEQALQILEGRMKRDEDIVFSSPEVVRNYLRLKMGALEHEEFGIIMVDTRHHFLKKAVMFRGTIDGASIHPREVVKLCLKSGPVAAILAYHNHPSGNSSQSRADERITQRLKEALSLVDIRVLDHLIVTHSEVVSLAERGLI